MGGHDMTVLMAS
jgi:translation initiation factor 3 subunit E